MQPANDVAIIQIGDASALMGAMAGNAVQAATLQPPSTILAAQLGYRELLDLSRSGLALSEHRGLDDEVSRQKIAGHFSRIHARLFCGLSGFSHAKRDIAQGDRAVSQRDGPGYPRKKLRGVQSLGVPEIPYVNQAGMETAVGLTPGY